MNDKMRVGFIGLGMLGKPISKRVLAAGYPLTVYDIRSEPEEELVKAGARKTTNPKEMAEVSDVVLTSLPSLEACEEIYFGAHGLLKGARKGLILVETSTVPPSMVKRYVNEADKLGVVVIDAPLMARTTFHPGLAKFKADEIAAQGLVTVMVGGDKANVEKVRPVLATFGNPIFHVGPLGSGEIIKVFNNAVTHAYFAAALEVLAVAAKAGVDLKNLEEIFRNTSAMSGPLNDALAYNLQHGKGKLMNIGSAIKDSEAMLELAREHDVPVLIQSVNHAYYEMAMQKSGSKDGPGDGDLVKLFESYIRMPLRFETPAKPG
ncbi:MAG: NAD(P)-dependent oxidoreductase [Betaproteobacteria bacterium]|nr:NAD(P)-dependent oxidoreductase [Betaproteobacteria bacterium]